MVEIVVLIKQVPDTNAKIEIKGNKADLSMIKWITSPYDEYAMEIALQHKEAHGGNVTALTLGPQRTDKILKDAKALGVDKIARINTDEDGYFFDHDVLVAGCVRFGKQERGCSRVCGNRGL